MTDATVIPFRPDVCPDCQGRQRRVVETDDGPQDVGPCPACALAVYDRACASADTLKAALDAAYVEHQPTLTGDDTRMRREVADFETTRPGETPPYPTPSVAALAAKQRIVDAEVAYTDALGRVEAAIGNLIWARLLDVRDAIRSPYRWDGPPLVVADVSDRRAGDLATATLTDDGIGVASERHDAPLDPDTMLPVDDPDCVPVYFEKWWGHGLRLTGRAHPKTRGVLDVDRVR